MQLGLELRVLISGAVKIVRRHVLPEAAVMPGGDRAGAAASSSQLHALGCDALP
jgi:hypothetical protein